MPFILLVIKSVNKISGFLKSWLKKLKYHFFYVIIPPEFFVKFMFRKSFNYDIDFDNCTTFNEKLQFRKLFDKNDLYTILTDKFLVRNYVSRVVGGKYLVPLFKAINNVDEINFDNIDSPFIIKPNNSSGRVIIVMDKSKINIEQIKDKCKQWMKYNLYYIWKEWQYKYIEPKIVIEKLILDKNKKMPTDYKFHCFGGKVKFIHVDTDKFGDHKSTTFNKNWELMDFSLCPVKNGSPLYKIDLNTLMHKPKKLSSMIKLSELLSKDFDYVRVDLYNVNNKIYFGELTFTPSAGFGPFIPKKYDFIFGQEWKKAELKRLSGNPKVSVIMAVYNSERFLVESIQSILNQSLENFELILVNDGSTDNSLGIIKKYSGDRRIKILNNKNSLGPAKARNKGLETALGEYIAVLDSDDVALKDRLKIQSEYLDKNKDIFLIGSNADIVDEKGNFIKQLRPICGQKNLSKILPKKNRLFHSSVMFRNKFIRYREKFVYAQDYDLYLNLLYKNKKIACLPNVLVNYRANPNNITFKNYVKQMLFVKKAQEFYKQKLKKGYDNYKNFEPNNILDLDVENNFDPNILKLKIKEKYKRRDYNSMLKFCSIYFEKNGYFDIDVFLYYLRCLIHNLNFLF